MEEMLKILIEGQSRLENRIDQLSKYMNNKMEEMDKRLNSRIDQLSKDMNNKMEEMDKRLNSRIDQLSEDMNNKMDKMNEDINNKMIQMNERLNNRMDKMNEDFNREMRRMNGSIAKIEVEHGEKLQALFDVYSWHTDKLEEYNKRIEDCELQNNKQNDKIFYLEKRNQAL